MGPAIVSRIKVMAGMNIVERRRVPGRPDRDDGRRARRSTSGSSTTPVIFGEKVVLRLLDKSRSLYRLRELGMPPETDEIFAELVRSPFGMVICTGPDRERARPRRCTRRSASIDSVERNVMTIEDPVEYILPTINQIQINEAADVTFAGGLKSILRQDPDVILVGEIRDIETARIAVQSALTGHFVLSSLHATDAVVGAAPVPRHGHRAVPDRAGRARRSSASGSCAGSATSAGRRYEPDRRRARRSTTSIGGSPKKHVFYRGEGCNFCSEHRLPGAHRRLRGAADDRAHAPARRSRTRARAACGRWRSKKGMRPLRDEALRLVADDITTIPEILRSVYPL